MKYRHPLVFMTNITGDKMMHESFESDNLMPTHSEMIKCTLKVMKEHNAEVMKKNTEYNIGVRGLSTFKNI